MKNLNDKLKHHVTGAIERGEATAIESTASGKHWVEGFAFDGEESFKIAECDTEQLAILIAQAIDRGEFKTKCPERINKPGAYRIRVVRFDDGSVIWEGR